jgi:hypothetical protein
MKKIMLALALTLPLAACGEGGAQRAVEANGFKDVKLGGTPWFACSESDSVFYNTEFTATAPNGQTVKGAACGGPMKGWTVRLY